MRGGNFVFATHRASVLSGEGGEALGGGIAELCAGVACVLIYSLIHFACLLKAACPARALSRPRQPHEGIADAHARACAPIEEQVPGW